MVDDVTCNSCVSRIHKALKNIRGVVEVEIEPYFKENRALVTLRYRGEIDKKDIEEALLKASSETTFHKYKPIWE